MGEDHGRPSPRAVSPAAPARSRSLTPSAGGTRIGAPVVRSTSGVLPTPMRDCPVRHRSAIPGRRPACWVLHAPVDSRPAQNSSSPGHLRLVRLPLRGGHGRTLPTPGGHWQPATSQTGSWDDDSSVTWGNEDSLGRHTGQGGAGAGRPTGPSGRSRGTGSGNRRGGVHSRQASRCPVRGRRPPTELAAGPQRTAAGPPSADPGDAHHPRPPPDMRTDSPARGRVRP
jgi:hypothetical protein